MNIVVVGLGTISKRVMKGIDEVEGLELYGIVSTSREKAMNVQATHEHCHHFFTLEEVCKDEKVDVIYLCTPNKVHYSQMKQCLEAKKHVCCEKPMLVHSKEVKEVYELARTKEVYLFEMQKSVHLPLTQLVKYHVDKGSIGELLSIDASFGNVFNLKEDAWVKDIEYGGSALDIGVYPLCYSLYLLGEDRMDEYSQLSDTRHGYEQSWSFQGKSKNQVLVSCKASMVSMLGNECLIQGSKGSIRIENFWKNDQAVMIIDGEETTLHAYMKNDFEPQLKNMKEVIECKSEQRWKEEDLLYYLELLKR